MASVCIKPYAVPLAAALLGGTDVAVGTTIGFPHGGHATAVKVFEAERAIDDGATELDMVVNIGQVLGGNWDAVTRRYRRRDRRRPRRGALVKVIFENCYLNDDQKIRLCKICGEVRADYVKTSTGYGTGGATEADLILMRSTAPASAGTPIMTAGTPGTRPPTGSGSCTTRPATSGSWTARTRRNRGKCQITLGSPVGGPGAPGLISAKDHLGCAGVAIRPVRPAWSRCGARCTG